MNENNARDINQIVGECAGAVSVCWSDIDKAGVFDSTQAAKFVTDALAEILAAGYVKSTKPEPQP
jgi:acyl-CoA thioesterase FadM